MTKIALLVALGGFVLGLLSSVGQGSDPPLASAYHAITIRLTHPAAASNHQHTLGSLNSAWHGSGSYALDWDKVPPSGAAPFGAHVHVVAWADTWAYVASTHSRYWGPEDSPSGCHELRTKFYNVDSPYELEGEYDLLHVINEEDFSDWWEVWGKPDGKMNDAFVGATATSDSCPWTGTHIHETHRNWGGNTFDKNTARFNCTCDPDANWLNWWNDHTRGLFWD